MRQLQDHLAGIEKPRVLDLGAGTGANLRALSPILPAEQHWLLIDSDPALLAETSPPSGGTLETRVYDLRGDLQPLFEPAPHLVTASAFFDLCGAEWIDRLVAATAAAGAAFHTVLIYDGRELWEPMHSFNAKVLAAFHRDQRRDKGLGPALGPDAASYLAERFALAGYRVESAASDWLLSSPADAPLIAALAEGAAEAVRSELGDCADTWLHAQRVAERVTIGHQDVLALPQ